MNRDLTDEQVREGAAQIRAGRPWMHSVTVPSGARRNEHPDVLAMLKALGAGWSAYMPKQHAIGAFGRGRQGPEHVDYFVRYYETAKGVPADMKPASFI